jgi:hypothetical protein
MGDARAWYSLGCVSTASRRRTLTAKRWPICRSSATDHLDLVRQAPRYPWLPEPLRWRRAGTWLHAR